MRYLRPRFSTPVCTDAPSATGHDAPEAPFSRNGRQAQSRENREGGFRHCAKVHLRVLRARARTARGWSQWRRRAFFAAARDAPAVWRCATLPLSLRVAVSYAHSSPRAAAPHVFVLAPRVRECAALMRLGVCMPMCARRPMCVPVASRRHRGTPPVARASRRHRGTPPPARPDEPRAASDARGVSW